jgi:hypothetical protein
MPHSFTTSPAATGEQRKFVNPTRGFIGVNIFGPDGKPTAIAVEPGGEVWLTEAEERMTAEAPRLAHDNPFVKQWEEPVEWDSFGEPIRTVTRDGMLTLVDEAPRPTASDRFIPARAERPPEPEPETVTGAPELSPQPAVQGRPSPDEVLGTPEAPAANDQAVAQRKPTGEQPTRPRREPARSA